MRVVKVMDFNKWEAPRDIVLNLFVLGVLVLAWSGLRIADPRAVLLSVLVLFLHEGVHGIFFKLWTGKVSFGAGFTRFGPVLYATSIGSRLPRNRLLFIALAPQILTLVSFTLMLLQPPGFLDSLFFACAVVNLGGGGGDFWSSIQLLRYPKELCVEDQPYGITFYMPEGEEVHETI